MRTLYKCGFVYLYSIQQILIVANIILRVYLLCSSETDIRNQHYKENFTREGYVNSVVLGSSVYNNKTIDVGDYVQVLVHLSHTLDGNHFNLTSRL